MSYLEYTVKRVPSGFRKVLFLNWPLILLLMAVASIGFLQLYSVSGGNFARWAEPQMERFAVGMVLMFVIAFVPIYFWRNLAGVAYVSSLILLVTVEFFGEVKLGAKRWIDLGFISLQPSELMKITLVMMLAAYYDWLDVKKTSRLLWILVPVALVLVPAFLVLRQPDLGTGL
ncbi:MAG: FtsW/RodA/SpoVE family cell cycle protein, partial [Pseudomonadota bacterium]